MTQEEKIYTKTDLERIVKERIAKQGQRIADSESRATAAEAKLAALEKKQASFDVLTGQLNDLQSKLDESKQRFDSYQTITQHGVTEPDLIKTMMWKYSEHVKDMSDKEKPALNDWIQGFKDDPQTAPASLKPHFISLQQPASPAASIEQVQPSTQAAEASPAIEKPQNTQPVQVPNSNNGAVPAPERANLLQQALDPRSGQDFYNQNHETIMKMYMEQMKGRVRRD